MADLKISALPAATAPSRTDEFEANQSGTSRKLSGAQLAALTPQGYISGLSVEWVSATSIRVTTGAAEIQSLGRVVEVATAITKSGLILGTNSWYHAYLYLNAGSPDIEIVTTAPATAYFGTAASKGGDTSRRYLGSVRTDGAGNIRDFDMDGETIRWAADVRAAPFRVLSGGTATVWTSISLAPVLPVTARSVSAFLQVVGGTVGTEISSDSAGGRFVYTINPDQFASGMFPFNVAGQVLYYKAPSSGSGALYVDVNGFTIAR